MILVTVHRSPGTCLTSEENHREPQLGDRLLKGLCKWGPFPPTEGGKIAQHVRKGEGDELRKERGGMGLRPIKCLLSKCLISY